MSFTLLQPSAPISSAYERSILQSWERGRRAGGLERINVLGATTLLFLSESPTLSSLISFELSFCHALPRTMTQYLLSLSLSSTFYWKRRAKVESGGVSSLLSQSILSQLRTECAGKALASQWFTLRIKGTPGSQGSCKRWALNASTRGVWEPARNTHVRLYSPSQDSDCTLHPKKPLKHLCRMRMESRVTILN